MADANEQELVRKVKALVQRRFGGNYKTAFDFYSKKRKHSGQIDKDELIVLLEDANVGNGLTRGTWATAIINKLDKDKDLFISYSEFQWMEHSA